MNRFFLLFAFLIFGHHSAVAAFHVAAGHKVLNPAKGTYLAGYGQDRTATGRLDDLYLKAAVIQETENTLVLFTLDNIGLTRPDILRIEAAVQEVLPAAKVVFSSTHTHAGPDVVGIWGSALWRSGRNETYLDVLTQSAAELALTLSEALVPATSRAASAELPIEWIENVSEPDLLDRTLSVLQFVDSEGNSILTLTNAACHPTVLGPDNRLSSADYVAGFYQAMDQKLEGEHMFLQGAVGGWVQPLQGDRSQRLALQYGEELAAKSLQLLNEGKPNEHQPLNFKSSEVQIPLENWGFRALIWINVLQRDVPDGNMVTSVATFNLGSARFVTHPGETSPAYSLESRELAGGDHVFIMGLTQDAMGYILKPEYFTDTESFPSADYLTAVSAGARAGPLIMNKIKQLLE